MEISSEKICQIVDCKDITSIGPSKLIEFFRDEKDVRRFLPERPVEFDPRSGDYVIFNAKRAVRPADNDSDLKERRDECVICSGRTTRIVDVEEHGRGSTFINKNLFPILYPFENQTGDSDSAGFHFLQWTSSRHEDDWTNMMVKDLTVVFSRLAALEGWLIKNTASVFPAQKNGWVSIIKNYGKKVGGSLEHDHQQIGFSSVMPGRLRQNLEFFRSRGVKFSGYMNKTNPKGLTLRDYGPVKLIIPSFMKRPLNMMLLVKDEAKDFLHELSSAELKAVSLAWSDAITILSEAMLGMGRETAYNVITNTGCGIYFEFLPFTQEFGGFEHMGLYLCQMLPEQAYNILMTNLEHLRGKQK